MSRIVSPQEFVLFSRELTEAFESGKAREVADSILPGVMDKPPKPDEVGPPVALRWTTTPLLGFPRQPFKVFRRPAKPGSYRFVGLTGDIRVTGGTRDVEWGLLGMYHVRFTATPDAGQTLVVEALDRSHEVITGQRITFNAINQGRFRSPGIAALRVTGSGTVTNIRGVDQQAFANESGWELIEVVGLPLEDRELTPPAYDPQLQGYVTPSRTGLDAAMIRLKLARILHLPLPLTGIADIPTPTWPAPDPGGYLSFIRGPDPSPWQMIKKCLLNTDDSNPEKLQHDFIYETEVKGIRQADLPSTEPGDPTKVSLQVAVVTFAASSDSYAATALGYGTIDFPNLVTVQVSEQALEPDIAARTDYDYMVTAEFIVPFYLGYSIRIELAALAQARPDPETPAMLTASTLRRNRAPARDAQETAAVQLKWNIPLLPQGYGVLVSPKPGASKLLNSPRPIAGGFDPYIPLYPPSVEGDAPTETLATFTDPISLVPFSGTQLTRYMVIGLDVFGRWSEWRLTPHTIAAPPVQAPGLHSAQITTDVQAAVGRVVPGIIEIEFAWDWSDRSLGRVEFAGKFFPKDAEPDDSFFDGFALSAAGAIGPRVSVQFNDEGKPSIASAHTGTVEVLTMDPPDPDRRKYRLTIQNLSCDFTADSELAYAVYARATECKRPGELSDMVGPRVARTHDPLPPQVPALPIDLQWTALPDATGRARGVLTWPASPYAAGYVVWEATESALRHIIDPDLPDPPPGTSLVDRATQLREILTTNQTRSLIAFTRLNTKLITDTKLEIELPGSASTIYAYRVSSMSDRNVESERSSTVALFAVPKRNQPGQPRLILRQVKPTPDDPSGGIRVIALPGDGTPVAGFRVYRVRSAALLSDVGMKGPPKIEYDDPGWTDITLETRSGLPDEQGRAINDNVPESWYPYYYQIIALGMEDIAAGEYRGESLPSAVVPGFMPPTSPPVLMVAPLIMGNRTNRVLVFNTSLPVKQTQLGVASIEVVQIVKPPDSERIKRQYILSTAAHQVAEGPRLTVILAPTPKQLEEMPEINRRPTAATGLTEFTVRMKVEVKHGVVIVRDPLGRTVEAKF